MKMSIKSLTLELGLEIGCAGLLAAALAVATGGAIQQAVKYLAVICFLNSIWLATRAAVRGPAIEENMSEWSQALILSVVAACAHFMVV
jgi:hypothetical protein